MGKSSTESKQREEIIAFIYVLYLLYPKGTISE